MRNSNLRTYIINYISNSSLKKLFFVFVLFFSVFFCFGQENVYTWNGDENGNGSWSPSLGSLSELTDGTTSISINSGTYTIDTNCNGLNLSISSGAKLIVQENVKLELSASLYLYYDESQGKSELINNGEIEIKGALESNGKILNNNTISVTGVISLKENSEVINNLYFTCSADINNSGELTNNNGGIITSSTGVINNNQLINNNGGNLNAPVTNSGNFENSGTIGSITNNDGGTVSNTETGKITGTVTNNHGGSLTNSGTVSGTVTNNGTIENSGTGTLPENISGSGNVNDIITEYETAQVGDWNVTNTWVDKNGDGTGDIPDVSGERAVTVVLNHNVNIDDNIAFYNKGNEKINFNTTDSRLKYN